MARVLFVLDATLFRVDGRMAGLQVRTYEMGRALARRGHEVVVAAPPGQSGVVEKEMFQMVDIGRIGSGSKIDLWISPLVLAPQFYARLRHVPMVIDGYEPPFGSFFWSSASFLPKYGNRVMYQYRAWIQDFLRALSRADCILCANEYQKICYITLLCALGKINPKFPQADRVLTVCSGAAPEAPSRDLARCPELQGVRSRGPVILWAGGCYPWFDVETYCQAMPGILARIPNVTFLFAGIDGVERSDAPRQEGARKIIAAVEALPELKRRSVFMDWLTYRDRGLLYAAADLGVCTYRNHIETTFSMRTRMIDMVWGRLPLVTSRGDSVAKFLEENRAGVTVPAGDAAALTETVVSLLSDLPRRSEMAARCDVLAREDMSWDREVEPLHRFCLNPQKDLSTDDPLVQKTAARMIRINNGPWWHLERNWFRGVEWLQRTLRVPQKVAALNNESSRSKTHADEFKREAALGR